MRLATAWHKLEERIVRDLILSGKRADGRDSKSLRNIECMVDVLPRVHGSAVFQRGETQALITVTLGTSRDEQRVDGLFEEYSKKVHARLLLPAVLGRRSEADPRARPARNRPRRTGRTKREAGAARSGRVSVHDPRDLRHFRIERFQFDGQRLRGDAGLDGGRRADQQSGGGHFDRPGERNRADQWILLTDIIGDEDHFGDMDFKVAGTQNGITGIQLDLKIDGISQEIIVGTLQQAREARIQILRKMLTAIPRPRDEISATAPRLLRTKIDPEKIGALIGPGGKTIRGIQERTGAVIEVDDDGTVIVASDDAAGAKAAMEAVESLTASVQIGRIYEGRVTSIKDFGAFIEILPGKDGLCHISELSDEFVRSVGDVVKMGDMIQVKVIAVDDQDRVKLSRKQAMRELGQARRPRQGAKGATAMARKGTIIAGPKPGAGSGQMGISNDEWRMSKE